MAWTFYDANGNSLQLTGAHTLGSHTGTLAIASGGTASVNAADALEALGVGITDGPQFATIELGNAADTTLSRVSAGDVNIQTNIVYRAGGTDVPVADGGTGLGSYAQGDIVYYNSGITLSKLNKPGTPAGEVLTFATGATAPTWVAASAGVGIGLVIALGG